MIAGTKKAPRLGIKWGGLFYISGVIGNAGSLALGAAGIYFALVQANRVQPLQFA